MPNLAGMETIAFCGIGLMGAQMAGRLRAAGHTLRVWNRTREKSVEWAKGGGTACDTPAQAALGASQAHLMLSDDVAVEQVLFAKDGLLTALAPDALVVDHSTVSVRGTGERAQRIKASGRRYLQAPMLAGPANVASGDGLMLVAGAKDVYDSAAPVLGQIVGRQMYLGANEPDAAAFKLMANSMLLAITEALAEYFALGRASGISADQAFSLFSSFDPGRTIQIRGSRMASGEHTPAAFHVSMAAKDAALMLDAARDGGASIPTIEIVWKRLRGLMESGKGDLDLSALGL